MENISVPNTTVLLEDALPSGDIFSLVIYSFLFVLGVPGNCLVLRVYWTKPRKTSTHVLIMRLAWADISVCLLSLNHVCEQALLLAGNEKYTAIYRIIFPFELTAIGSSMSVTSTIAADRYDCICRPHKRIFTQRRGKIALFATLLVSLVINLPQFIEVFTAHRSDRTLFVLLVTFHAVGFLIALVVIVLSYGNVYLTIRKHVKVGVRSTELNANELRPGNEQSTRLPATGPNAGQTGDQVAAVSTTKASCSYNGRINNGTVTSSRPMDEFSPTENGQLSVSQQPELALPKVSSAAENPRAVPGNNIDKTQEPDSSRRRRRKSNAVVLQRKTTRMLFITSVVFLLTWLPYWIYVAVELASFGGASIDPNVFEIIGKSQVTLYINNAVNPLIYGIANRRFRKDCWEVLRKIRSC